MCIRDRVMESALSVVRGEAGARPDLVVVDGPLIPPARVWILLKRRGARRESREAALRYLEARRRLIDEARERGVSLVGFVKRPRSMYLYRIAEASGLEHPKAPDSSVAAREARRRGDMYPEEPVPLMEKEIDALIPWEGIVEYVRPGEVSFAMLRTSDDAPPYRVDFGPLSGRFSTPADVASYLVATADLRGIPAVVALADESVKLTRRVARDAYEDAVLRAVGRASDRELARSLLALLYGE